jgi:hypothetical protein
MNGIVVKGLVGGYRTTKDGGLNVTIELDEHQAARFHESFHGINILVAVARLATEEDEYDGGQ